MVAAEESDLSLGWFVAATLSLTLFFSLLADPVVRSFGLAELALALGVCALAIAGGWAAVSSGRPPAFGLNVAQCLMIALAASFGLSALIGIAHGAPFYAVARSVIPYAIGFIFVPLILAENVTINMRWVLGAVLAVGLSQACYHLYLFFTQEHNSTIATLAGRITLIDARVTLPLAAVANGVALSLIGRGRLATLIGSVAAIVLGVAALVTLTRTLVLVYVASTVLAVVLWTLVAFATKRCMPLLRNLASIAAVFSVIAILMTLPMFHTLHEAYIVRQELEAGPSNSAEEKQAEAELIEQISQRIADVTGTSQSVDGATTFRTAVLSVIRDHGIDALSEAFQRSSEADRRAVAKATAQVAAEFSAHIPGADEVGGGRISQEWLPALQTYRDGSLLNWLFGTGAGVAFNTASGEPRTYVHNFPIYLLLYNGIVGAVLYFALQAYIAMFFVTRVYKNNDFISFACLIMLATLNGFALLFAVHKLVAFNLLMGVILLAYVQQQKSVVSR